ALVLARVDVARHPSSRLQPHCCLEQLTTRLGAPLQERYVLASASVMKIVAWGHPSRSACSLRRSSVTCIPRCASRRERRAIPGRRRTTRTQRGRATTSYDSTTRVPSAVG